MKLKDIQDNPTHRKYRRIPLNSTPPLIPTPPHQPPAAGSFKLAVCAREHGIPVYACVPAPTIDLAIPSGRQIEIEERHPDEVRCLAEPDAGGGGGPPAYVAPPDVPVFNPAFDITPAKYLTGIITDQGVCYPPFEASLRKAVEAFRRQAAGRQVAAAEGQRQQQQ